MDVTLSSAVLRNTNVTGHVSGEGLLRKIGICVCCMRTAALASAETGGVNSTRTRGAL